MKKYLFAMFLIVLTVLLTSCQTVRRVQRGLGFGGYTGFTELPFPSNSYVPGQIVEIFSKPKKVEITHQPDIPWDQASVSEGWNMSNIKTNIIKSTLSAEISKILKGTYDYASTENVKVELTNTKIRMVQKSIIYSAVKNAINNNPDLEELIDSFMDTGSRFDVITTTLSANVSFVLVDASNNTIAIDSEVIKKINSEFNIDFNRDSSSNRVVSGCNLVIGIHTDPKMIRLIMKRIQQSH